MAEFQRQVAQSCGRLSESKVSPGVALDTLNILLYSLVSCASALNPVGHTAE